jgi:hypothetical protein
MTRKNNNPTSGATALEYHLKNSTIQAFTKPTSKEEAKYQTYQKQQLGIMEDKLSTMKLVQDQFSAPSSTFNLTIAKLVLRLNELEVALKQLQVKSGGDGHRSDGGCSDAEGCGHCPDGGCADSGWDGHCSDAEGCRHRFREGRGGLMA